MTMAMMYVRPVDVRMGHRLMDMQVLVLFTGIAIFVHMLVMFIIMGVSV